MKSTHLIAVALAGMAAVAALAQGQSVESTHAFEAGDIISLRANDDSTYRIVSCEPATKRFRQCNVVRLTPYAESHERPLVMENYTLSIVGRGGAPAAATPAPAAEDRTPAAEDRAPAAAPVQAAAGGGCARSAYGGPVPGNRQASAALFRQKITDTITMGNTARGWYGVQLTNFRVGGAIRNGVGMLPGQGASRVNNGAPVGAVMYPVSTTMSVCEAWNGGSNPPYSSEKKYLCFVSANNEWTCGPSN